MSDYVPLSDEEAKRIAEEFYSKFAIITTRQDNPTAILIAGQPGSGKTAAAEIVKSELLKSGGYVHIDADELRLQIPGGEKISATQTQADCRKMVEHLRNLAIAGGRNIVEEGTFRNRGVFSERTEEMHSANYRVEVIGVATSREHSRLSVLERRENLRDAGQPPRDVPEPYQDDAYDGYTQNMIHGSAVLDRVRIVNRAGDLLYDSADKNAGLYRSTFEALEEGRKLSDKQIVKLANGWQELQKKCEAKGLQGEDMARIHESRNYFNAFVSAEKHRYGMRNLEQNAQELTRDSRFHPHSDIELVKTAYWRGVCEKDQIFQGKTPDMSAFDAKLSDRAALQKLPDVADLKDLEIHRAKTQGRARDGDHGLEL